MKIPLGVRRLDEALQGGLPERSATLFYGPPFLGKETLAKLFVLEGLRKGQPAIIVLTDESANEVRAQLRAIDPTVAQAEAKHLVHFVDCYSKSIGMTEQSPDTEFVDGLVNFNAVNLAVNNAQRKLIADHPSHRLLFDSVSTLITYTDAQTAFRFLQVLLGRARAAGATSVLLLEQGMHSDSDVQTIKHLTNGVFEFKQDQSKTFVRCEGTGYGEARNWVEHRHTDTTFDITGSFAMGRIR